MLIPLTAPAQSAAPVRGLRVDPGLLYDVLDASRSVTQIAQEVVDDAYRWNFNTLFVYAYNSVYGGYYPTTYGMTKVEGDLGKRNIFAAILSAAQARGMKVIAVLPVNDFKAVWMAEPTWRVKTRAGKDFKPSSQINFLSVSNEGFKTWYTGFVNDFLNRFPAVNGIEAVEPGYDLNWGKQVDFNPAAVAAFNAKYPGQAMKGQKFLDFRAQELSAHLGLFSRLAHAKNKEAHVVQTWTATSSGALMSATDIKNGLGLDFDGLLNLPLSDRPDILNVELIWQQWRADYGSEIFNSAWPRAAGENLMKFVNGRADLILHVELSEFSGPAGSFSASSEEVLGAVQDLPAGAAGFDVYDYSQWKN